MHGQQSKSNAEKTNDEREGNVVETKEITDESAALALTKLMHLAIRGPGKDEYELSMKRKELE